MKIGPLDLLVIQGTPFCNINCDYCYLPDRQNKSKISFDTIELLFERLFSTGIVQKDFTVTWHAGEPLVMGVDFYKSAFEIIQKSNNSGYKIRHNFQTNATLIDDSWCKLFKENNVFVCVSIDGPKAIHDKHRIARNNSGTFEQTYKGINMLKQNNIQFDVISVITSDTLNMVQDFFNFFYELQPRILGINIEEIEGSNISSSLFSEKNFAKQFHLFYEQLLDMYQSRPQRFKLREVYQLENFLLNSDLLMEGFGQQSTPFRILSVANNGDFSTFSPELLSMKNHMYNNSDFIIGNIHTDDLVESLKKDKFTKMYMDILSGIHKCKLNCSYFGVCGGGTPSNKYFENGTFDSTETSFCKLRFQSMFDSIISRFEKRPRITAHLQ